MAITLKKEPASHETAIDMHWHLTNLARVIQVETSAVALYEKLQRTLCSEEIFEHSKEVIAAHPMLEDNELGSVFYAYHYFVVSWVGRNGVAGTKRINYQMAVRWTPGGGHGGVRFRSAVESLPWWHQRLRQVTILRRDIFDVLPRIDDVDGVVIYVDPPYLPETRAGCEYLHDFCETETLPLFPTREGQSQQQTHEGLAEQLRRFKRVRVVVSYYYHPRLESLYPGWTVRRMYRQKNLHVQNRRGTSRCEAPEVLLINGPSYANPETTV
jgi:DNA adenine methylase